MVHLKHLAAGCRFATDEICFAYNWYCSEFRKKYRARRLQVIRRFRIVGRIIAQVERVELCGEPLLLVCPAGTGDMTNDEAKLAWRSVSKWIRDTIPNVHYLEVQGFGDFLASQDIGETLSS